MRTLHVIGVFCFATSIFTSPTLAADGHASDPVVVEVNGHQLTLKDLEEKRAPALFQARATYYDTERKVVEDFVDDYLLEQQAKKEGLTVAELLEKHVNSQIAKDPSEEALHVYFEGLDTTESYDAVRPKILDALRQRRIAKAKSTYIASLRSQASVVLRLAPPRAQISMKDVPVRGASRAPITLVEFADYECPYCQQLHPLVTKLEEEFKGKIAFAYKDYPLGMHPDAPKAAEAAHCAGAQGKYWEYHDLLFTDRQLSIAALKHDAEELHLDAKAFDACLDSGQMSGVVKEQATEAMQLGLPGTPAVFVNGRAINGNSSYEKIRAVILEELSATGSTATVARGSADKSR